jgi:hypothetical protein
MQIEHITTLNNNNNKIQHSTSCGAAALNKPLAVSEGVQAEAFRDLVHGHGVGQILLVGKHEQNGVPELVLGQHAVQLLLGAVLAALAVVDTLLVVRVDHKDDALCVLVVVAPQGADLVLAPDVPHGEADVLVLDRFHVEPNRGDRGHDLTQLELVQNRCLAGWREGNNCVPVRMRKGKETTKHHCKKQSNTHQHRDRPLKCASLACQISDSKTLRK